MKVVILAGGLGTRISEYTKTIPKPMIEVCKKPLIYFIMKHYANYGFKNFYIALGYKGHVIKKYLGNERFMLTYGDGLSNVNIKKLLNFHKKNRKLVTLTAARPPARFGAIKILGNKVKYFKEKSKLDEGWINGGFFVMQPEFLNYIKNDQTFLEREPMELLTKKNQLVAFKHDDFWQCMDTKRDMDNLNIILKNNNYFG